MFRAGKAGTQALTAVEEFRVRYEQFTGRFGLAEDAVIEQVGAGGFSAKWFSTSGVTEDRVVMYLQGKGNGVALFQIYNATPLVLPTGTPGGYQPRVARILPLREWRCRMCRRRSGRSG